MSTKPTPEPVSGFIGGGGIVALAWSTPFILLGLLAGQRWALILALPLVLYLLYLLHGMMLLVGAWICWRGTPVKGILVWSDSPIWRAYIEQTWLPYIAEHVVLLNWSERKRWRWSLAVLIHRRFGIGDDNFNYNPMLIIFRGLRYPYVYRYFHAFRDAKHGNTAALRKLEGHMFDQLRIEAHAT
jgi:hypothetical protein